MRGAVGTQALNLLKLVFKMDRTLLSLIFGVQTGDTIQVSPLLSA